MKKLSFVEAAALFVTVMVCTFFMMAWGFILHQTRNQMRTEASLQQMLETANVSYEKPEERAVSDRVERLLPLVNENVDRIEGMEDCVYYVDYCGNLQYYTRKM